MLLKTLVKKASRLICFFLFLLTSFSAAGKHWTGVSFFIVAHEDDWQLFMGRHAKDVVNIPGRKLVLVYITAGDAGAGNNIKGNGKIPYYMARENAAARSTDFLCRNVADSTRDGACMSRINGHDILMRRRKNTVSYFLRLPDGGMRGEGSMSLRKLYRKSLSSLTSVDSTGVYNSWHDLVATVGAIISKEAGNISGTAELNIPDVAASRNPGDHMDHYLAGVLALSATKNDCYSNILYTGYNVSHLPKQIADSDTRFKQALLKNIGVELAAANYPDCQDNWHMSFTENEYSIAEADGCNYPDSNVFYVRKFGVRAEDDESDEDDFTYNLYPNPASGILHLSISDRGRCISSVRILDLYGNMQKLLNVCGTGYAWEKAFNISELPAGTYLLEIVTEGRKNVLRFVKQ